MDTPLKSTVKLTLPSTASKDLGFDYQLTLAFIPSLASYGLQSGEGLTKAFCDVICLLGGFCGKASWSRDAILNAELNLNC